MNGIKRKRRRASLRLKGKKEGTEKGKEQKWGETKERGDDRWGRAREIGRKGKKGRY